MDPHHGEWANKIYFSKIALSHSLKNGIRLPSLSNFLQGISVNPTEISFSDRGNKLVESTILVNNSALLKLVHWENVRLRSQLKNASLALIFAQFICMEWLLRTNIKTKLP
jgi:hypothetical protein